MSAGVSPLRTWCQWGTPALSLAGGTRARWPQAALRARSAAPGAPPRSLHALGTLPMPPLMPSASGGLLAPPGWAHQEGLRLLHLGSACPRQSLGGLWASPAPMHRLLATRMGTSSPLVALLLG